MVKVGPPLSVLVVGPKGLILTDGGKLYWVFPVDGPLLRWAGMEVNEVRAAFPLTEYTTYCGGEIDMRQSDDDPMTPEIMELGDRVADALTRYFTDGEKRAAAEWSAGAFQI